MVGRTLPKCALKVYAACALDEKRMQGLAACYQAWKPRVLAIIGMRVAAMIGGDAAGLVHDHGGGCEVPFGLG